MLHTAENLVVQPAFNSSGSSSSSRKLYYRERKKLRRRKTRSRPGSENRWSAGVGSGRRRWSTPERRRRAPGILSTGIPRTHQHARSFRPVAVVAVVAAAADIFTPLLSYTICCCLCFTQPSLRVLISPPTHTPPPLDFYEPNPPPIPRCSPVIYHNNIIIIIIRELPL